MRDKVYKKRRSVPYFVSRISYIESEDGVALLLILWVLFLLTIISAEFAFSMRTDFAITINFREEIEAYYLAQAGVNQAIAEILQEKIEYDQRKKIDKEGDSEIEDFPSISDLTKKLGKGSFEYNKIDEETKININALRKNTTNDRKILMCLLEEAAGVADEFMQETIVDSIMDWMDHDDLFKPAGAEEDYYQGLSPPYHCKNGPFDTVEELLLVQGVTREILFGTVASEYGSGNSFAGIGSYLTVWTTGRFNREIAEEMALRCKLGEEGAEREMERRREKEDNPSDIQEKEKAPSRHWTIEAVGHPVSGGSKRTIKAVVRVVVWKKVSTIRVLFWDDNYINRFVSLPKFDEGAEIEYE